MQRNTVKMQQPLFLLSVLLAANNLLAQAVVSADKMNELYMGIDNPLEVAVEGEPLTALRLEGVGAGITITGENGKYIARVNRLGDALITVFIVKNGDKKNIGKFLFRCKRISDPIVTLNGENSSGMMTAGKFKLLTGIMFHYENMDLEVDCSIQGFDLTLVRPTDTRITVTVVGTKYNKEALQLRDMAASGFVYYFDNIKARCPGDFAARKINSMVWRIK